MDVKEARFTLLINGNETIIEFRDNASGSIFLTAKLTAEQTIKMLSRQSSVELSECSVYNIDKLNKKLEHKKFEFEIPQELLGSSNVNELHTLCLSELAKLNMRREWEADKYYRGQDSFFSKDVNGENKQFARVTIRRWVD